MFKTKLLILLCVALFLGACSLIGKKDKNEVSPPEGFIETTLSDEAIEDLATASDTTKATTEEDTTIRTFTSVSDYVEEETNTITDVSTLFSSFDDSDTTNGYDDQSTVYKDVIQNMQDEINTNMVLMGCKNLKELNSSKIIYRK